MINAGRLRFALHNPIPHPSCAPGCKLLLKHDMTSRNKDHPLRPCTYCSGFSQKMLHSHYGGRLEEFCRPHCMSQYTVLYYGVRRWTSHNTVHCMPWNPRGVSYCMFSMVVFLFVNVFSLLFSPNLPSSPAQMGRCDSCRKQGYMTEKLQCLGSVRNFCNLPCLLQYCCLHFETSQHSSSNGTGTAPQTPYGKLC